LTQNKLNSIANFINSNGGATTVTIDVNKYKSTYAKLWNQLQLSSMILNTQQQKYNPDILFNNIINITKTIEITLGIPTLFGLYFINKSISSTQFSLIIPNIIFTINGPKYFDFIMTLHTDPTITSLNQYKTLINNFYNNLSGNTKIKILNLFNIIIEYSILGFLTTLASDLSLMSNIYKNIPIVLANFINDLPDNTCIFNNGVISITPDVCSNLDNKNCPVCNQTSCPHNVCPTCDKVNCPICNQQICPPIEPNNNIIFFSLIAFLIVIIIILIILYATK
jgi:hypothetical protein